MDNLDPNYMQLRELFENLCALSPNDGDIAGRLPFYTADGQFIGEFLPSTKDLAALNAAVAQLVEIAESMRKYGPDGPDLDDHFNQILWELDLVTPWDPAATGETTTTVLPTQRVSPPSEAALWATHHADLAADLDDVFNESGLSFPANGEGGDA